MNKLSLLISSLMLISAAHPSLAADRDPLCVLGPCKADQRGPILDPVVKRTLPFGAGGQTDFRLYNDGPSLTRYCQERGMNGFKNYAQNPSANTTRCAIYNTETVRWEITNEEQRPVTEISCY